ncbi:MAG: hypothetical protein PHW96_01940 [Candidatus Nanoarchaeia archaeon]|nr:hypothetical protein [Candidatus Nanoarchaeia archaeon]
MKNKVKINVPQIILEEIINSEKRWYNSKQWIEENLNSFEDFHRLVSERHDAGYIRHEGLFDIFVLDGRFKLDCCGNLLVKNKEQESCYNFVFPGEFVTPETACEVCKEKWTIDNLEDFVMDIYEEGVVFLHEDCNRHCLNVKYEKIFRDLFEKSGYKDVSLSAVKNQYCGCSKCAPWYEVNTEAGKFLIGWRKRVINIDCSEIKGINLYLLFRKEETTKGKDYIHAWGYEKAEAYLSKIHNKLKL